MNKEFLKMQKLAGLINESQMNEKQYAEPMIMIQNIVDNWADGGIDAEPAMIRIDKILQGNFEDEDGEGFISEDTMMDNSESKDNYLPLTPEVKQFIDKSIADIRNSSDDKEWEYLKRVEFWEQDFEENMLVTLSNDFPNAYMISPEVTDYIGSKIYGA
jgi:hypothetical protein